MASLIDLWAVRDGNPCNASQPLFPLWVIHDAMCPFAQHLWHGSMQNLALSTLLLVLDSSSKSQQVHSAEEIRIAGTGGRSPSLWNLWRGKPCGARLATFVQGAPLTPAPLTIASLPP